MNFCPNCGSKLAREMKFCGHCGKPLEAQLMNTSINHDKVIQVNRISVSGNLEIKKAPYGLEQGILNVFEKFLSRIPQKASSMFILYIVILIPVGIYSSIDVWSIYTALLSDGNIGINIIRLFQSGHVFLLLILISFARHGLTSHRWIIVSYVLWLWYSDLLSTLQVMNYRALQGEPQSNAIGATLLIFFPLAIVVSIIVARKWQTFSLKYLFVVRSLVVLTILAAVYDVIFEVVRNFELLTINVDLASACYVLFAWYLWICILISTFVVYAISIQHVILKNQPVVK